MPSGHLAGPVLAENHNTLIEIGIAVLNRLGDSDVGQSVIVQTAVFSLRQLKVHQPCLLVLQI